MRECILTKDGFKIQDIKLPSYGDNDILIKVIACGVCSGDVFVFKNREKLASSYPRLGHEASGIIAAVGKNVRGFTKGDMVTTFDIPAYAEYLVTNPDTVVALPPNINPIHALGEPIACCVHAANRFGTQMGDRIAILGAGFMGLICQQLVRYQGADFICTIDPLSERREMAKQLNADAIINPSDHDAESILAQFGLFDIVIEAAGNQSALDLCTPLVKEHGRIILIGYHQSNDGIRTVNMEQWNLKAIDVVNGHVRNEDEKLEAMSQGMGLVSRGDIVTESLISIYPFEEINDIFSELITGKPGLIKAVLSMNI